METFIQFAYTGKITLTEINVHTLITDADYFDVIDIKDKCVEFLESSIHSWDVFKIYSLAEKLNCVSLKGKCDEFIGSYFQEVSESDDYCKLSFDSLKTILSRDNVRVDSQEKVFTAVIKWITYDLEDRKNYLPDLLQFVRFADFTADYLTNFFFDGEMAVITKHHKYLFSPLFLHIIIYSMITHVQS